MPIIATSKQLVQRLIPTSGTSVLYLPTSDNMTTFIKTIIVCNTTAASKTYSLWVNQNGTASADQFALIKGLSIAANATDQIIYPGDAAIILKGSTASILASASVANAVTITIYGIEVEET